ncbi:MAG TPA: hypothetical protein VL738_11470 [Dactylosporangium sp.]|nr:hypothetical protein [Dactylosporangium sp.]
MDLGPALLDERAARGVPIAADAMLGADGTGLDVALGVALRPKFGCPLCSRGWSVGLAAQAP